MTMLQLTVLVATLQHVVPMTMQCGLLDRCYIECIASRVYDSHIGSRVYNIVSSTCDACIVSRDMQHSLLSLRYGLFV